MKSKFALLLCSTIAVSSTGCTSGILESSRSVISAPMSLVRQHSTKRVSKVLSLWEPSEGVGLDGSPSRGFAGQVMFFTFGKPSPIKVGGTVKVYLYANFDEGEKDRQPQHVFTFVEDGWEAHRSEGTLGHSYNIFLPSGEVASDVSHSFGLRVEHTDLNGRVTKSPFTEVTLAPKTTPKSASASAIRRDIVKRVESKTKIDDRRSRKDPTGTVSRDRIEDRLDTMTISLPQH
ncbi:MAG: hypothetical protein NXI04_08575 [Planctomycetaceae bacterium]|nr:hypothetical protein [Planctomycetaceae bacterium]